jgi:hypothetical protein
MITRVCRGQCGKELDINEFSSYKDKKGNIKYSYYCKKCDYLKVKEYRRKNKEKHREQVKRHYEKHKEERLQYSKEHYKKYKEVRAQNYQENKDEIRQKMNAYYEKYPEKKKEINKKYFDKRYQNDMNFRISHTIGNQIRNALFGGKNNIHWEELVDFTLQDLMNHLELLFDENMNWDNFGKYWQIDHIVPINAFNIKSYEDETLKKCWCLENLQPLDYKTNVIKSDQINETWNNVELAKKLLEK